MKDLPFHLQNVIRRESMRSRQKALTRPDLPEMAAHVDLAHPDRHLHRQWAGNGVFKDRTEGGPVLSEGKLQQCFLSSPT